MPNEGRVRLRRLFLVIGNWRFFRHSCPPAVRRADFVTGRFAPGTKAEFTYTRCNKLSSRVLHEFLKAVLQGMTTRALALLGVAGLGDP